MNETLTEQDFRLQADHALEQTQRSLLPLADKEGFEVELQNGVLQIVFEDPSPAKFVVSPNTPVRQIWISAHAKSYKLDWDIVENSFVHTESGATLKDIVEKAISKQLNEEVSL